MNETWAMLIHQHAFGGLIAAETFEYADWMEPLCNIYRNHYGIVVPLDYQELARDIDIAYKAGLNGDLDAVDRFVGGYELAGPHEPCLRPWPWPKGLRW